MKAHFITQRPVFDANQNRIHEIGERSIVIITITKYQQSPDTWETPYTQKTLSQHLPHASPSASPFHPDIWGTEARSLSAPQCPPHGPHAADGSGRLPPNARFRFLRRCPELPSLQAPRLSGI